MLMIIDTMVSEVLVEVLFGLVMPETLKDPGDFRSPLRSKSQRKSAKAVNSRFVVVLFGLIGLFMLGVSWD